MRPKTLELVNDTLAILWEDGQESYFTGEALRRACPCAMCQGEKNVLSEFKPPPPNYTPASFELRGWEHVGGYAIQPRWADGHDSGIYSFEYLRQLDAAQP